MTDQDPGVDTPARPDDPEQVVDDLENRVIGHRVDQARSEDDDPDKPAFEQDIDTADPQQDREARTGPGGEPSS